MTHVIHAVNPLIDDLWQLQKPLRRQPSFRSRSNSIKAQILIGRDDAKGKLQTSYRHLAAVGTPPQVNHTPDDALHLVFGTGALVSILPEQTIEGDEYFTIRHDDQDIYRCQYIKRSFGPLVSIIVDFDRMSFAETPLSMCHKIETPPSWRSASQTVSSARSRLSTFAVSDTSC